jgi:SAM-dependent methyltransferase
LKGGVARKRYDAAYYQRWYRAPETRVKSTPDLERTVAMVLALAEYHLERRVRSVLDVGCGEGRWRAPLLRLRPRIDYLGLDGSEWAIARHGRRRNLHRVDLRELADFSLNRPVDLLICNDVIQYVDDPTARVAAKAFRRLCDGVMFVTAFTSADDFVGDRAGYVARPARWYRRLLETGGWSSAGSQCWLSPTLAARAAALELH